MIFRSISSYCYRKKNLSQAFFWAKRSGDYFLQRKILGDIKAKYSDMNLFLRKNSGNRKEILETLQLLLILEGTHSCTKKNLHYVILADAAKEIKDPIVLFVMILFVPSFPWKIKSAKDLFKMIFMPN